MRKGLRHWKRWHRGSKEFGYWDEKEVKEADVTGHVWKELPERKYVCACGLHRLILTEIGDFVVLHKEGEDFELECPLGKDEHNIVDIIE